MKKETTSYKVIIFDEEYHLVSDEQQELVLSAAAMVDNMMQEMSKSAPRFQKDKLAVLAALQCATKFIQAEKSLDGQMSSEAELVKKTEQLIRSLQ